MSLSVSLGNALSGLQVNQRAIEVTSHNVANAHTEGYSRQTVNRETVVVAGQGSGVRSASIGRTIDEFIVRELRSESGNLGAAEVRDRYLGMTQDLFGSPGSNTSLTARLADFAAGLEALAVEPQSTTRRSALLDAATVIARDLNESSSRIQSLRTEADREIAATVGEVNAQLEEIAKLNASIVRETTAGRPTSDLLDARDRAIRTVSGLIDVQHYTRSSGEAVLYTRSGQPLVDQTAHALVYTPAPSASPTTVFDDITIGGSPITGGIGAGKLKGLLDMRDGTLAGLQSQFDTVATRLRDEVNRVHNRGTGVPAPQMLSGTRTFGSVDQEQITISHPVRVAVLDQSGVVQGHHDLPAGTYTVAGLRDAINAALGGLATASVADGGNFSLAASGAGHGVALVDLEPSGGDATIAHTAGGATRQFKGLSNFLGLNDFFVTPGQAPGAAGVGTSESIAVRPDLVKKLDLVAGARLTADPAPVAGTTVGVALADTSTLEEMSRVFDRQYGFPAVGSLAARNGTLGDYASDILGQNALEAAGAADTLKLRQSMVDDLGFKASAVSGVNVDEEMANLVVYQNAYAASARLVSVVSEMFDTLTRMA